MKKFYRRTVAAVLSALMAGSVAATAMVSASAATANDAILAVGLNDAEKRIVEALKTTTTMTGSDGIVHTKVVPQEYIEDAELYLATMVNATDAQADKVIESIEEAKVYLSNSGAQGFAFMTDDQYIDLVAIANKGAKEIGTVVTYDQATRKVTAKKITIPATAIKLSATKKTLNKGKTFTLKATLTPADSTNSVKWTTSNKKVATVTAGKVTAVGKGTATITATTTSGKKATCKVTVKVPSTKVKLNVSKKTVNKGNTYTLKATLTPSDSTDTLTWTTSNKKVATVDKNGKVTAVKKGTATITVKTESGKTAKCKVTVRVIKSTKVKLDATKKTIKVGKTATLKAKMTPTNSTDTLKWTSSNKKVATVDKNGKVYAVKKGTATITVKTESGKKATCKVTVK